MYDKDRDFITIDGTDFSGILDGDGAFTTSRTGDSIITRVDSSGKLITFKASDNTITGSITVRPDAKTALKKLRQLMNTYKSFKISRDNRNPGGEKKHTLTVLWLMMERMEKILLVKKMQEHLTLYVKTN